MIVYLFFKPSNYLEEWPILKLKISSFVLTIIDEIYGKKNKAKLRRQ